MAANDRDWGEGYVVDVEYVRNFHPGLTPMNLAVASVRGGVVPPDVDGAFTYLDIGCGNGFTPALIAAACPHAQVWGNDFMPEHIRNATAIADAAGLTNAHFVEASFAALLDDPALPDLDIAVAHGIWSWVNPANRARIVALLAAKLKPGGLFMVSYNCHPGWDALMPLRRLLATAGGRQGSVADRIERAFETARALRDAGADYFANAPAAAETLDVLLKADRAYIAHEFLNESWSLFHPGEVAVELAPAGLSYVGPARIIDGFDDLWLTEAQRALIATAPDVAAREAMRDLILDRRFRHDLFARTPERSGPERIARWFADRRFALARPRADCAPEVTVRDRETALPAAPFTAILDALAEKPMTGTALAEAIGRGEDATTAIPDALGLLVAIGHVQAALPEAGEGGRRLSTGRFNAAALDSARMGDALAALASPVTGGGVPVPGSEQVLLDALQSGLPLGMVSAVDADGVDIAGRFRDHRLPVLEMLGIL